MIDDHEAMQAAEEVFKDGAMCNQHVMTYPHHFGRTKCQGTTLVVPYTQQNE
jgi:hypothetical protein